jgi:hypothetical protein
MSSPPNLRMTQMLLQTYDPLLCFGLILIGGECPMQMLSTPEMYAQAHAQGYHFRY